MQFYDLNFSVYESLIYKATLIKISYLILSLWTDTYLYIYSIEIRLTHVHIIISIFRPATKYEKYILIHKLCRIWKW